MDEMSVQNIGLPWTRLAASLLLRAAESDAGPRGSKWMQAPCLTVTYDNSIFNSILFITIRVATMIHIEFALSLANEAFLEFLREGISVFDIFNRSGKFIPQHSPLLPII